MDSPYCHNFFSLRKTVRPIRGMGILTGHDFMIELQTKESRPSREVQYMRPNTQVISTYTQVYMAFYDHNTRNI